MCVSTEEKVKEKHRGSEEILMKLNQNNQTPPKIKIELSF
jgi:hypothetical protein